MKNIFLCFILLLTSCSIHNNKGSILEDSTCEAPCWNEVRVGETTAEEMLNILNGLSIVQKDSVAFLDSPWEFYDGRIDFFLYPNPIFKNSHDVYAQSHIIDNTIVDIKFCGYLNVTFGDIVNLVGEPKYILVIPSISGGSYVIAVNEIIGVQYWYDTQNAPKNLRTVIVPEIQIDCLSYFDPSLYDEMLEAGLLSMRQLNGSETISLMQKWSGYGNVEDYVIEK